MDASFGANVNAQASVDATSLDAASFDASATLDAAADLAASASASLDASLSANLDASFNASVSASFDARLGAPAKSKCRVGSHVPDPWLKFRYKVEIDGIGAARFKRVEAIALRSDEERTTGKNGGSQTPDGHLPPRKWHWDPVSLKRGMASDGTAIWKWVIETATTRPIKGRDVVITLVDDEGKLAMQWTLSKAYPVEWILEPFDASANETLIESIKLAHGGISVQFKGEKSPIIGKPETPSFNPNDAKNSANNAKPGTNANGSAGKNTPGTNIPNSGKTKLGNPPPSPTDNTPHAGGTQAGGKQNSEQPNGQ